ncbi:MAG: BACON domain-containing protein [Bacteroidales bacterium]|nr:BACON domain-containing protein [Bacteroidales bacterium]
MKHKILSIIAAAAAVLGAAACTDLLEQDKPVEITMSIAMQPDSLEVKAEGDAVSFTFNAPDYWFASCPADWVTIDPASGKPGDATITVKAVQNVGTARSALVTVTSKTQRGQFKIKQAAWPYSESDWFMFGTVGSGVVALADQGDKLVWAGSKIAYNVGETFKFRMGTGTANVYGIDGNLELADGVYSGKLSKSGKDITLPEYGYWDVTLDLNNWNFTATLVERFPWTIIGTIGGADWDQDFAMTDGGNQLIWNASRVETHDGELFKFRMNGAWTVNLGADGEFVPVEGKEKTWELALKQDGENIALPKEGFWDFTLDVDGKKLTAVLVEEFIPNPLPSNWEALWVNPDPEGIGEASWDGKYRFALDGMDGNNECIATFSDDTWDRIKNETLYVYLSGANPQVRVTDGWWAVNFTAFDFQPGNDALVFNNAKTWILTLNLSENADLSALLDEHHLLFTGVGFAVLGLYAEKKVTGDTVIWSEETAFDSWSATLVVPAENFATAKAGDIIRVYLKEKGDDYNPIFKHVDDWSDWTELQAGKVDTDGYFEAVIPADALDELKEKGLRFQGVGFTVRKIMLVVGPDVLFDTETAFDSWSATLVVPAETFANAKVGDLVRVYIKDKGDDYNPIFKHVEDWSDWAELQAGKVDTDEYFEAAIPAEALEELQAKGLRFQGVGFTVTKVVLAPGPVVLWDTEAAFDSWSATIVIPAEKFETVMGDDIIRVFISGKGDDYNPIFKHAEDWSDWTELQGTKVDADGYFEATVPDGAVDELKEKGLRFQGVGFTITKVILL